MSKNKQRKTNSLSGLVSSVANATGYQSEMLSQPFSLAFSNSYNPITLNYVLLSYAYMTHGVLQTMVDQPVADGFRDLNITSDELTDDELDLLRRTMDEEGDILACQDVIRWSRLFGGAGLIINTNQLPDTPLSKTGIFGGPLEFIAADRWELAGTNVNINSNAEPFPFRYYSKPVHRSRVITVNGKKAPSFLAPRLQGWGLSCFECTIRDINSYVKNQSVIYELLDEAKIDIYRIQGFNTSLDTMAGEEALTKRIEMSTMLKNFRNSLAMDIEDDYEQKQLSFAGLSEMLKENRIGIAASVRMPMTKLFGMSAAGFNSGEDDIENYNSIVESQVREKAKPIIQEVARLRALQLFGFEPEIEASFEPLRILSAEQEENVKNAQFTRLSSLYDRGLLTPVEFMEALNKEKLINMDTQVGEGIREPVPPQRPADETPSEGSLLNVK